MRQLLRDLPSDSAASCDALHRWLLAHPGLHTIATYSPLPGEVDLSAAIARHPHIRWLYPKVSGHHLTFHTGDDLRPGAFGILEPHHESPEFPLHEIDAILCPGLAFDKNGGRLGRGRGFYDRLLAQACPDTFKLGICFPEQVVPDTFSEVHDIHMDEVISSEPS